MNFLFDFVYEHPILAVAQLAFMCWMLVDAARRRAEQFWFWIIILVPVLGPWVYFFAVKAPTMTFSLPAFASRPSLAELHFRAERTPTLANHLALGERLLEREDFKAALPALEAAHKLEPDHGQVLYSLALCRSRLGQVDAAVPLLDKLVQRDPRWSNYQAWQLLVDLHLEKKNQPAALERCRELVNLSPTLENKCLLAELLGSDGHASDARELLEQALRDHEFTGGRARRRNRYWAREAKRLLKRLA